MAAVPDYIEDYLRIIKEELKNRYNLTEDEAAKAVYKSAVRSILCGENEELRRYQMHKSLAETALDVYRQYKNVGLSSATKNGEDDAHKINVVQDHDEPIREKQKEAAFVLQDIPLMWADDQEDE